jgi:hypothetical protein
MNPGGLLYAGIALKTLQLTVTLCQSITSRCSFFLWKMYFGIWISPFHPTSHIPHRPVPLCAVTPRVRLSRAASSPIGQNAGFSVIWVLISPLYNLCIFSAVFRVLTLRDTCPLKFYVHLSQFFNVHVHCIPAVLYLLVVCVFRYASRHEEYLLW